MSESLEVLLLLNRLMGFLTFIFYQQEILSHPHTEIERYGIEKREKERNFCFVANANADGG